MWLKPRSSNSVLVFPVAAMHPLNTMPPGRSLTPETATSDGASSGATTSERPGTWAAEQAVDHPVDAAGGPVPDRHLDHVVGQRCAHHSVSTAASTAADMELKLGHT